MAFKCPFCSSEEIPTTTKRVNTGGWVLFVVLLLFCFPLCFIPFLVDGCKDEVRKCLSCGSTLG